MTDILLHFSTVILLLPPHDTTLNEHVVHLQHRMDIGNDRVTQMPPLETNILSGYLFICEVVALLLADVSEEYFT